MAFNLGSAVGYLLLDTSNFEAGFAKARNQFDVFNNKSLSFSKRMQALGSGIGAIGGNLTKNITLPLAGLATVAISTAGKFESSMSQVQATLGISKDAMSELDGETVNTMQALEGLARQLGADTKYSASEAAEAINNMAMAGYDVQEIYDTLPQVLSLASAGCLDLDYATQLVANGLNVMGKDTSYAQELADKLAVTASNAYGSVSDFGEGLLIAGGQASLANLSFTDTFTALGILGDNGISASEGGTMLRNTLKNLYTPTSDAAKALEELGVETANSDGTLRSFQDVLKDLSSSLDGLTEEDRITAMSRIFDTRTISGANALLKDCGDRWDELAEKIDNADGAAEQMAETQLDNLPGQLTILKSALEEAAIAFGQVLLPVIKDVIKFIQKIVDWINNLTDTQKDAIVKIAELAAIFGPVLLIVGKIVGVIGKLIGVFTGVISPIGLIIGVIALLVAAFIYLWNTSEDFRNFWINLWNVIVDAFKAAVDWIKQAIQDVGTFFSNLGQTISDIWNTILSTISSIIHNIVDAVVNWGSSLYNGAVQSFNQMLQGIKTVWDNITSWLSTALDTIVETVKSIGSALFEAGKSIFTSLWDGLKSVWESIVTWVNNAVQWIANKLSGATASVSNAANSVSGSGATGLDYISHDSVWQLHEGEAVLSKEENAAYRAGKKNSGDTYNFYSPKALTPTASARAMKKLNKQLAMGMI